jgi:sec-independent protein translocase protein TatA
MSSLSVTMLGPLGFIGSLGPMEMMFVVALALLVFGKDLPQVAREWGRAFNEFRRHLNSVRSELNDAIYAEPERPRLQYHPEFHKREESAATNGAAVVVNSEDNGASATEAAAEVVAATAPLAEVAAATEAVAEPSSSTDAKPRV